LKECFVSKEKKVRTFRRKVEYARPGAAVGEMKPASFIAVYEQIPAAAYEVQRIQGRGIDMFIAMNGLIAVEEYTNDEGAAVTGEDALAEVRNDSIAVSAQAREYAQALGDGVAVKNLKP
jgi:hypothetical protein